MRKLFHDRRGVIALEFAFVAPAALMLAVGGFDVGVAQMQMNATQTGLAAAGNYVMSHSTAAGAADAARSASNLLAGASVDVVTSGSNVTINVSVPVINSGIIPGMPHDIGASGTFALKS